MADRGIDVVRAHLAKLPPSDSLTTAEHRAQYERAEKVFPTPSDVKVERVNAPVAPAEWLRPPSAEPGRVVLYLHGGGYVIGSPRSHRHLAAAIAGAAGASALLLDYRLAPEHPFPAAIEDAVSAYGWMLERGIGPDEVTISGDSSGGGLVVSVLLTLKQRGLPQPGGAVLMCPWVDLELNLRHDEGMRRFAAAYLGGHPADDPVASPLGADLTDLPPLLIQAATGDDRLMDANALADRARDHGVDARLELYSVDAHVFQLFWSFLPEAAEAVEAAGRFVRDSGARESRVAG